MGDNDLDYEMDEGGYECLEGYTEESEEELWGGGLAQIHAIVGTCTL